MREWQLYRTGECVTTAASGLFGFFKSNTVLESKEFAEIPAGGAITIVQTYDSNIRNCIFLHLAMVLFGTGSNLSIGQHSGHLDEQPRPIGYVELISADPAEPLAFHPSPY